MSNGEKRDMEKEIDDLYDDFDSFGEKIEESQDRLELKLDKLTLEQQILMFLRDISYKIGLDNFYSKVIQKTKDRITENFEINDIKERTEVRLPSSESDKITTTLRSGLEFLEVAKNATLFLKPILIYYGMEQIYSSFINMIFSSIPYSEAHGLHMELLRNNNDISWHVAICPSGFFKLLVISLEFLIHDSNIFSVFFYKSERITSIDRNERKFVQVVGNERRYGAPVVDLLQLLEYDEEFKEHYQEHNQVNKILIDFVGLFLFCSVLRYKPKDWVFHLKGEYPMFQYMNKIISDIYFHRIFDSSLVLSGLLRARSNLCCSSRSIMHLR